MYSRDDILRALDEVELPEGCSVFLTAGVGFLGPYLDKDPFEDLATAILQRLGKLGTLVVPSYSYTFGKRKSTEEDLPRFNVQNTRSDLGQFSEWFRKSVASDRSRDPMVSVAMFGHRASLLAKDLPATSYGHGSIFERLLTEDCFVLNVGLGVKWTPFIHYVDFLCDVPHRYAKRFTGVIENETSSYICNWTYHVPYRCANARGLGEANGLAALDAGIWTFAPLGRARVFLSSYREYFDFTLERTRRDPWNLAVGPPVELARLDRE